MKRVIALLSLAVLLTAFFVPTVSADTTDLSVTALDWQGGDGQVAVGTALTFSATIRSDTAVASTVSVDFSFGDTLIQRVQLQKLAKGATTVTTKPWKATAGDRMVTVRVNADNTVAETELRNNTYQTNLRVAKDRYAPACNADDVTEAGMFDLTFSDDFNDLSTVDTTGSGREGFKWYVKRRYAQSDMTPNDYYVRNGVLTLQYADDTYTIGASTVDCESHAGYTYNHGYLEARVRMPYNKPTFGDKAKTAIWSLPKENWAEGLTNDHYVEADWFEYYENGKFGVTLHDLKGPSNNRTWWHATNHSGIYGLNDKRWHVMGWLWEEDRLRCYLDGELYYEQTWSKNDVPFPVSQYKSGELKYEGVFDVMDKQNMMLFIAGSSKMPLELDYVRIWEQGGTPPATTTKPTSTTTAAKTTKTTTTAVTTTTSTTVKTTNTTKTTATTTAAAAVITTTTTATTTTTSGTVTTTTSTVTDSTTVPTAETTLMSTTVPTTTTTAPQALPVSRGGITLWIVAGVLALGGLGTGSVFLLRRKQR